MVLEQDAISQVSIAHTSALSVEPSGFGIGVMAGIAAHVSLSSLDISRRPRPGRDQEDRARSSVG